MTMPTPDQTEGIWIGRTEEQGYYYVQDVFPGDTPRDAWHRANCRLLVARGHLQAEVSDTTSVWTAEGWLYVAVILELFSRLVVGWAMSPNNDEALVRLALEMALLRRSPPTEMLLHSDQGSPYTAAGYLARLAALGIVARMSRVGDCYDNAAMESFFSTLKGACVERCSFESRSQARQEIFEYIECFYNRERRHSSLNYLRPTAYEEQMR